ncbi:hypothetical protein [Lentibacter sp.]|jgi:hypothetical protein|uniref:hypothetical protein n=1 Tax=Lentibacter sp. TaxID=2024994 RepID=UPI003F6A014C
MRTVAKFAAIALIAAPTFAAADSETTSTVSQDALITTSSQGGLFGLGLGGATVGTVAAVAFVGVAAVAISSSDGT